MSYRNDYILQVNNINKQYNNFNLKDVSFKLKRNSITGFIGPNGAGKSTTIKSIMNIVNIDSGDIIFNGKSIKKARNYYDNIGYIGDTAEIYPKIKLRQLTKFYKRAHIKKWDNQKFNNYFYEVFNLNDSLLMQELSNGMRMKYFLALELSKGADLLLLDEPTAGLDPLVREELLTILYNLSNEEGKTIFLSSHITEDIDKIAKNIIYIQEGRILLHEKKKTLQKRFGKIHKNNLNNLDSKAVSELTMKSVERFDYYLIDRSLLSTEINDNVFEKINLDEILLLFDKEKRALNEKFIN